VWISLVFPNAAAAAASPQLVRIIAENAHVLRFKGQAFEAE
jgi:hypothetical protein